MKTRFIVNLRSGRATRALRRVQDFARAEQAELVITERRLHARDLAEAAVRDGVQLVVAVGGDGTMNEVATALLGRSATLGLVPCGSGDGLGRQLGVHGPIERALRILQTGRPRLIDSGTADGHPFFSVAGLGFEAQIAKRFNELVRRGFLRYLTTSASALAAAKAQRLTVRARGRTLELSAFTLAVANSCQYGNNAKIAPRARLDDGLLNLCAVPAPTFFNAAPLLARLFSGGIEDARGVTSLQADQFVVERAAPGPIHTDGETHDAGTRVEFVVRRASLRVMAP